MSNDPHSLIGRYIGKYKIESMLGRGGMAEVYKAYQENLERHVAIKLMYPFMSADENFVNRFKREALTMARIDHVNIVRVYDFDVENSRYYIVMQFIQGGTLKEKIEEALALGQLVPLADTVQVMLEMADALAYAHSYGMVHRDIKPGNIMLSSTGRAILTDFGIAKMTSGTQYTATGAMVGTPAYMSPEQGLGKSGDERSDLYALGVLFYNLVTGRLPHEADTPIALLLKHVNEAPLDPRSLNPNLPYEIESIIYKLLEKEPEDRYQTANDFARELRQAILTLRESDLSVVAAVPMSALEDKPTPAPASTFASAAEATQVYDITPAEGVQNPAMMGTQVHDSSGGGASAQTQVGHGGDRTAVHTPLPSEPLPREKEKRGIPIWLYAVGGFALIGIILAVVLSQMGIFGGGVADTGTATPDAAGATITAQALALAQNASEATEESLSETREAEEEALQEVAEATAAAETALIAEQTREAAEATAAAVEVEPDVATETPVPTDTPTPEVVEEIVCVYDAEEVDIYTYQSSTNGTSAPVGSGLSLNFVLRNTGNCSWPEGTSLQHSSGRHFGQDEPFVLTTLPEPETEATVRIERLFVPADAGEYLSGWNLVDDAGNVIGDELQFGLIAYATATAVPTATVTPEVVDAGGGDDGSSGDEPVGFAFDFSNCTYPGGGSEYECRLNIVPYGGPSGTYTVWVFDADQPAEYQQRSGSITHFLSARRCSPWIHSVKIQNNQSGEEITQDMYFDPTSRALFPDGTCSLP